MAPTPRPTPISLDIPSGLEITYANLARISHSPADIVMDFAHALPGENKAVISALVNVAAKRETIPPRPG